MLSQRTDYAIARLQHLADRYGEGPVPLSEIAEKQNIPPVPDRHPIKMSREGLVDTSAGGTDGYYGWHYRRSTSAMVTSCA